ncbi:MAG: ABC transporter ATP-binding protein [Pseudomonadota bacterium]
MFAWFEQRIDPYKKTKIEQPPDQLSAFYWHFAGQVWVYFAAMMFFGLLAALIEISLFTFLGQLVDLLKNASNPETFFAEHSVLLLWMAFVALIARPIIFGIHTILGNQVISANFTALIRWQTHRYLLRQSLSFFQNDFAGRIANKVMQVAPSLRETLLQLVDAVWFVLIYTIASMVIFFDNDARLMVPLILWFMCYVGILYYLVPKIKDRSTELSEANSMLTGRIVDSYTNIHTVKLFTDAAREDDYAKEALDEQRFEFERLVRLISIMEISIWCINGALVVSTSALAIWLWTQNLVSLGAIAVAIGLVIRINNMSAWIMWVITSVFENIGRVQEAMETIAKPLEIVDIPQAKQLHIQKSDIVFDNIKFHYGKKSGIIDNLSLDIASGEKVGLVGRSGAGKSTLVSLLLRFYDLENGQIRIDGQNIAHVNQDSLRANIGMVTQDPSLLHRSVRDNILYGLPDASEEDVIAAAKQAQAHDFILELEDLKGRKGYDAHVGERGVKLSGGQRQRVAIARVLLKNAPILILDEATSALDSEVEAAIQEQLYNLMQGKTVIAIAHRLSTIAAMDRLIIMDQGQIIEQGKHDELIKQEGVYSQLWSRQSGGFIVKEATAAC